MESYPQKRIVSNKKGLFPTKKLKDGKSKMNENDGWKILMDWGPCSVTCGGGVMTMQR